MNPNVTARLTAPDGIATRLRNLRKARGVSQATLAEAAGWAQSKVSRIEAGGQLPTPADAEAWAEACGAPEEAGGLAAAAEDAETVLTDWRKRTRKGHSAVQASYNELAANARRLRNIEIAYVPGLLQTWDYAVSVGRDVIRLYGDPDGRGPEGFAAKRMERAAYLADTSKRFEFVLTEEALTRFMCSDEAMVLQLRHLERVAGYPNVRLGILPSKAGQVSTLTNEPFAIYDDTVWIEPIAVEGAAYGGAVAETYVEQFELHQRDAVEGDEARALIVRAADALR